MNDVVQRLRKINPICFCMICFCCFFLLSSFTIYLGSNVLQLVLYVAESFFVFFCLKFLLFDFKLSNKCWLYFMLFTSLLIVNFVVSGDFYSLTNSFKLFQYVVTFLFSYKYFYVNQTNGDILNEKFIKRLLLFMIIFPVFFVVLFTNNGYGFFPNSNVMCFYGMVVSFFSYVVFHKKKSALILIIYLLAGKTIGPVVAVVLSFFLVYFKPNVKSIILCCVTLTIFALFFFFSDITIFVRLRNVVNVFLNLSWYDLTHMASMDYGDVYDLSSSVNGNSMRNDDTSFLFRIITWSGLVDLFMQVPIQMKLFGVSCDLRTWSVEAPHNDYLWFFINYGIFMFFAVLFFFVKIFRFFVKKNSYITFFTLSVFCYYITENLITYYPGNIMFYFLLGMSFALFKKNHVNRREKYTFSKN